MPTNPFGGGGGGDSAAPKNPFGGGGGAGSGASNPFGGAKDKEKTGDANKSTGFGSKGFGSSGAGATSSGGGFGSSSGSTGFGGGGATATAVPQQPSLMEAIERAISLRVVPDSLRDSIKSKYTKAFLPPGTGAPDNAGCTTYVNTARELLILLLCDFGSVQNLPGAIGAVSSSMATNMCQFLGKMSIHVAQTHSTATWGTAADGSIGGGVNFIGSAASLPTGAAQQVTPGAALVAVAQCLFMLSKNFQLNDAEVKEMYLCAETLMTDRLKLAAEVMPGSIAETQLAASLHLVALSVMNALAPWAKLYKNNGDVQENALAKGTGTAAKGLLEWIQKVKTMASTATDTRVDMSFRPGQRAPAASAQSGASPVEGPVAIMTLSTGMCLVARGDDSGLDVALEAMRGDRGETAATAAAPVSFGGHVCKHLYKSLPSVNVLQIPRWLVAESTYLAVDYLLRHLVPVVKRVADLDVASYRAFTQSVAQSAVAQERNGAGYFHGGPTAGPNQQVAVQVTPYSSDMVHLLKLLRVCAEEIPAHYFAANPVTKEKNHVTTFIFRNTLVHLRQVFNTHKQQSKWEPYTFSVVRAYFDLLAALSRSPEFAEKVYQNGMSEAQLECSDIRWSSVLAQCRDCAGVTNDFMTFFQEDATRGNNATQNAMLSGYGGTALGRLTAKQLSQQYLQKKHCQLTTSVFLLLRQIALTSPSLGIQKILSLEDTFAFVAAPRLRQSMAGAIFSFLATMITTFDVQELVWQRLNDLQMLQLSNMGAVRDLSAVTAANAQRKAVEGHDLAYHCFTEMQLGSYDLTKGVLRLLYAMFQFSGPGPQVSSLIRFVANDIMCGVTKRPSSNPEEIYEVTALGCALLVLAFRLELCGQSQTAFHTILATAKAPANVTNDLIEVITRSAMSPDELTPTRIICLRNALDLLASAMDVERRHNIDNVFTFDARTRSSDGFALSLLGLVRVDDPFVVESALRCLTLMSPECMSSAVRALFGQPQQSDILLATFSRHLVGTVSSSFGVTITAPASFATIEASRIETSEEEAAEKVRYRLVEVMNTFAEKPLPSLTSWLCGLQLDPTQPLAANNCLRIVLSTLNDEGFRNGNPRLAVQYARTVYSIVSYSPTNMPGVRDLLRKRDSTSYWSSLYSLQPKSDFDVMHLCGIVMRTLALEVFHLVIGQGDEQLLRPHLKHLIPAFRTQMAQTAIPDVSFQGEPFDLATAVPEVLMKLPTIPVLRYPRGSDQATFIDDSGCRQYDLEYLRWLFLDERPNMSGDELAGLLNPFLDANHCLRAYHLAVSLVEGWGQLVEAIAMSVPAADSTWMMRILHSSLKAASSLHFMSDAAQDSVNAALTSTAVYVVSVIGQRTKKTDDDGREAQSRIQPVPSSELNEIVTMIINLVKTIGKTSFQVRMNLYNSLLLLLSLPTMEIDSIRLLPHYPALFEVLVADAIASSSSTQFRISALQALSRILSLDRDALDVFAVQRGAPTAMLNTFVNGALATVNHGLVRSLTALAGSDSASTVICHTDTVFNILCIVAEAHAFPLNGVNALPLAADMAAWSTLANGFEERLASGSSGTDVGMRALLGLLRFANVFLRNAIENESAANDAAEIVRRCQSMIRAVLEQLALRADDGVSTMLLDTTEQIFLLLRHSSCSSALSPHCPELIGLLNVGEVFDILTAREFRQGKHFVPPHGLQLGGGDATMSLSHANTAQHASIARITQYVAHFLLCCFDKSLTVQSLSALKSTGAATANAGGNAAFTTMEATGITSNYLCDVLQNLAPAVVEDTTANRAVRDTYVHVLGVVAHLLGLNLLERRNAGTLDSERGRSVVDTLKIAVEDATDLVARSKSAIVSSPGHTFANGSPRSKAPGNDSTVDLTPAARSKETAEDTRLALLRLKGILDNL